MELLSYFILVRISEKLSQRNQPNNYFDIPGVEINGIIDNYPNWLAITFFSWKEIFEFFNILKKYLS